LYTDWLTEAQDRTDEEFGHHRMKSFLKECSQFPASTVVNRRVEDARTFAAGWPIFDDLTVMAIEMVGHCVAENLPRPPALNKLSARLPKPQLQRRRIRLH